MKAWGETLDPGKKSGVSNQCCHVKSDCSPHINFRRTRRTSHSSNSKPISRRTRIANSTQIRFLGDPQATFTNALDLAFDSTAIFGQPRSKRYALIIEDGIVKEAHVEPDNTGVNGKPIHESQGRHDTKIYLVSAAEKVLA